jgi:carboxylesterase type B
MQLQIVLVLAAAATVSTRGLVVRGSNAVEYVGAACQDSDMFLGIPYAQDTGDANRFKPPRPYTPAPGEKIDATKRGPACPQPMGRLSPPLALFNVTEVSENCLNLNIARPRGVAGPLPVAIYLHGGSFW